MKNLSTLLLSLSLALVSGSAVADTFTFTASGPGGFQSSGTIVATASSNPNLFDVTAITGEVNNVAITGLLPCAGYSASSPCTNSTGAFIYDNLLASADPVFNYNGIGFNLGTAGYQGNFYFDAGSYQFLDSNRVNSTLSSFSVAETPEPSTFVFLGTGLIGMAGIVRSRFTAVMS